MTRLPTFGLPKMREEVGELRDFLPDVVAVLTSIGCEVVVEPGLGDGMGKTVEDYLRVSPLVRAGCRDEAFGQDVVMVLRAPDADLTRMRPGGVLISMLHFPTRPARVQRLLDLGIDAISLDAIADDTGRRLVENMYAVGWNGLEAAFDALEAQWPRLSDPRRGPVRVTVMGAGTVGKHAIEAATKYGSFIRNARLTAAGVPGVQVTVIGRNLTGHEPSLLRLLSHTDLLVDASQRSDPSRALIANHRLALLPPHAVICDLVADPYLPDAVPPTVRGIEGIPLGNLDRWVLRADDAAWEATVPATVPSRQRRTVASCRAWPGIKPEQCMRHYGTQISELLPAYVLAGGYRGLSQNGGSRERALYRGSLAAWTAVQLRC